MDKRIFTDDVRHPHRKEVMHWLKGDRPRCNVRRGFINPLATTEHLKFVTCERCCKYAKEDAHGREPSKVLHVTDQRPAR